LPALTTHAHEGNEKAESFHSLLRTVSTKELHIWFKVSFHEMKPLKASYFVHPILAMCPMHTVAHSVSAVHCQLPIKM